MIAAGEFQNKIRVRGFSECTPPGTTVDLKYNNQTKTLVTGLQGEFDIELESIFLPEETLSLTFHLENQTLEQPFRVRTAAEQKANLTETSIVTGQVPNDLEISSDKIWVLASADS